MTRVGSIAKREFVALFHSPIAYVVLFIFLLVMGALFALLSFRSGNVSEVRQFFGVARFCLFFMIPMMTMGLMADEQKSGRMEMLRTSPITEMSLLLGKYAGAMLFYGVLLAATLIYVLLLAIFGRPDYGALFAGYLGMVLLGMLFVSIGLFFSTITQDQIVAALATLLALGLLTFVDVIASNVAPVGIGGGTSTGGGSAAGTDLVLVIGTIAELYAAGVILGLAWAKTTHQKLMAMIVPLVIIAILAGIYFLLSWVFSHWSIAIPVCAPLTYMGIGTHMEDFLKGVIESSHVVYFLSGSFLFLFLTYLVLESRKWR